MEAPLGRCTDPKWADMDNEHWAHLLEHQMQLNCSYAPTPSSLYTYQRTPSPTARHYLVFAQAHVPSETANDYARRIAFSQFTLSRFKEQMGDELEMSVVELLDERVDAAVFPDVDTVISHTRKEGQDWGMSLAHTTAAAETCSLPRDEGYTHADALH